MKQISFAIREIHDSKLSCTNKQQPFHHIVFEMTVGYSEFLPINECQLFIDSVLLCSLCSYHYYKLSHKCLGCYTIVCTQTRLSPIKHGSINIHQQLCCYLLMDNPSDWHPLILKSFYNFSLICKSIYNSIL